jgi:hypothetical protein
MALPVRKLAIAAAVVALAAILVWWISSRSPQVQAPATFERIKDAIEDSDASGVVAQLHPRYDFAAMWPSHFSGGEASIAGDTDLRTMAKRGIAVIFLQRGDNHLRFTYSIRRIQPQPDGTVKVDATIEVGSQQGGGKLVEPVEHHWVLAPDGWLMGRLKILSHDPIQVTL